MAVATENLQKLIAFVRLACGDPTGQSHPALSWEAVRRSINWACQEICKRTELLVAQKDYTTVADTMKYALADNTIIRPISCEWNNIPLKPISWNRMLKYQAGEVDGAGGEPTSGTPLYYCIQGGYLWLFPPTETANYTVTLTYVSAPAELTADSDIPFYGSSTPTNYSPILDFHSGPVIAAGAEMLVHKAMKNTAEYQEAKGRFYAKIDELARAAGPYQAEDVEYYDITE